MLKILLSTFKRTRIQWKNTCIIKSEIVILPTVKKEQGEHSQHMLLNALTHNCVEKRCMQASIRQSASLSTEPLQKPIRVYSGAALHAACESTQTDGTEWSGIIHTLGIGMTSTWSHWDMRDEDRGNKQERKWGAEPQDKWIIQTNVIQSAQKKRESCDDFCLTSANHTWRWDTEAEASNRVSESIHIWLTVFTPIWRGCLGISPLVELRSLPQAGAEGCCCCWGRWGARHRNFSGSRTMSWRCCESFSSSDCC